MASEEIVGVLHRWRQTTAATLDPEKQECLVVKDKEDSDGK